MDRILFYGQIFIYGKILYKKHILKKPLKNTMEHEKATL